jgi:hypothetical protein
MLQDVTPDDLDELMHFHTLRHTTGSWLAMQDGYRKLKSFPATDSTDMGKYSHLAPERLDRAMEKTFVECTVPHSSG